VSADQVRARFDAWWKQKSEPLHPSMRFVLSEVAFDGWQAATASHAAEVEAMRDALRRIAYAQPDRLDHSRDVAIIERAARIAAAALKGD
jgi:hypothetical protein